MKFALDEQQRDFAASVDAALSAADVPAAVRAWGQGDTAPGRKIWSTLADLGVTALAVPEKFDGIEAHPADLVVALERLGRWCVPGPVAESIAVAPVLLGSRDEWAERSAALAAGELVATVALPPTVPRAVDADFAGLMLLARDGRAAEATAADAHESVDPARKLFDVNATGPAQPADVARAFRVRGPGDGRPTGRRGSGDAGHVGGIRQTAQPVRPHHRQLPGDQTQTRRCAHRGGAGPPTGLRAALSLADGSAGHRTRCQRRQGGGVGCRAAGGRSSLQTHGAIGFTSEHDLSLWLLRVQALHSAWGDPTTHRRRVLEALA